LKRHIARLQLDVSHLPRMVDGRIAPKRRWTDDDLRDAVASSATVSDTIRKLGYEPNGGVHRWIVGHIRRLGLDTHHFVGQGWAKGRRPTTGLRPRPLAEVLVANSTYGSCSGLRKRLIREGLKAARCEMCGLSEWMGRPLPLALDHINGDPRDNRLENLRILCPNCHALTDTWCVSNRQPAYSNWQRGRS
jgi:HNH endonuclease